MDAADSDDVLPFDPVETAEVPGQPGWTLIQDLYQVPDALSCVWLAEHPEDGRRVFKLNNRMQRDLDSFLAMLAQEVSLRQAINEAGGEGIVVPVVAEHRGPPRCRERLAPFIAFRYYAAGTLSKHLAGRGPARSGSAEEAARLDLVAQVADKTDGLHRRGFYHGDLRGPNVLLEEAPGRSGLTVWLTDLGQAGRLDAGSPSPVGPTALPRPPVADLASPGRATIDALYQPELTTTPEGPPNDPIAADVRQLGMLMYQCVTGDFSRHNLSGTWNTDVSCRVLRRIIEDTQRPEKCQTAADVARRVRGVKAARARRAARRQAVANARLQRRNRRVTVAACILGLCVVLLVLAASGTGYGWLMSSRFKARDAEAYGEQLRNAARELEMSQELGVKQVELRDERIRRADEERLAAERASIAEIIRSGDIALVVGAWRPARDSYRRALGRPDLIDPAERVRLRERVIRASIFLDDNPAAVAELALLGAEAGPNGGGPAADLDRAVLRLEVAMRGGPAGADAERDAVEALNHVAAEGSGAAPADRAAARGLLAPTYEEAEARFTEALAADPFHPFATVYLVSTAILAGRLELAAARAELWAVMNRDDPAPHLYRAVGFALAGRRADAEAVLARVSTVQGRRPYLPRGTLSGYRGVVRDLGEVHRLLSEGLLNRDQRQAFGLTLTVQLPLTLGTAGGSGTFRVPLLPAARRDFSRLAHAVWTGYRPFRPDPAAALDELRGVGSFVAPGVRSFFEGTFHLALGDKPRTVAALARAVGEPSFFDLRRVCLLGAAAESISQEPAEPAARDRLLRDARAYLRGVAAAGPMSPNLRGAVVRMLLKCGGDGLAEDIADAADDQDARRAVRAARSRPVPLAK